jgi:hypothetical protein
MWVKGHTLNAVFKRKRNSQYSMSAISLVATARACTGKPRPQIVHPRDVLTQHNRGMSPDGLSEQVRMGTRLAQNLIGNWPAGR